MNGRHDLTVDSYERVDQTEVRHPHGLAFRALEPESTHERNFSAAEEEVQNFVQDPNFKKWENK